MIWLLVGEPAGRSSEMKQASVLFGASSLTQLQENLGALALFQRHGGEIRDAVNDLWVDRGVVDPSASWGTAEGQKMP